MSGEAMAIKEVRAEIPALEKDIIEAPDDLRRAQVIEASIRWANQQMEGWEENGEVAEILADLIFWADEQG